MHTCESSLVWACQAVGSYQIASSENLNCRRAHALSCVPEGSVCSRALKARRRREALLSNPDLRAPRNGEHALPQIVRGWPHRGRTDMGSGGDCSTSGRSYYSVLGVHLLVSLTSTQLRDLVIATEHMSCTRASPRRCLLDVPRTHPLCVCQATEGEIKAAYKNLARVSADVHPVPSRVSRRLYRLISHARPLPQQRLPSCVLDQLLQLLTAARCRFGTPIGDETMQQQQTAFRRSSKPIQV